MRKMLAVGWLVLVLVLEACMAAKAQNNDFVADAVVFSTSGWIEDAEEHTWSYVSADAPTYVVSVDADMTGVLSPGMRWRGYQGGNLRQAIITAVGEYSGGATQVTLFGGASYTVLDAAITSAAYSSHKAPFGFPLSPSNWTVEVTDSTNRTQASPVSLTWYNLHSSHKIDIPIGVWKVSYYAVPSGTNPAEAVSVYVTLSTANNSESDVNHTNTLYFATGDTDSGLTFAASASREIMITVSVKTTYYLNIKHNVLNTTSIGLYGEYQPTVIRAVCAYL